ncbi:MAG: transketolase C-terminal domain-containing protein [Patescibacteria group bacterium]
MLNPKMYLNPKLFDKDVEQVPTRNGYGEGLVALGKINPNVVVLTGDLKESTRVEAFAKEFPERFIECGVAEQNMAGIAAGLGVSGKIPFISSYAVFSPGRSWDQVRVSICYNDSNVKIVGAHTGVSVGPDGATHQALEDIAITRVLPHLTVMVPCDANQTRQMTIAAAERWGPIYFRFTREKTPVITTAKTPFEIGPAQIYWQPKKGKPEVTIIACGPLLFEALLAAKKLEEHDQIASQVINLTTIKPIDTQTLAKAARITGAVVTVEEHQVTGGMGSAVAETLASHAPVPIEFVGMPDSFGESGEPDELLIKYGMKSSDIIAAVRRVIKRK